MTVPLTIALSAAWHKYPERFEWLENNGFAVEYTINPDNLPLISEQLDMFAGTGIPIRYHAFFPDYEIGQVDKDLAENALKVHMAAMEALSVREQPVITMHIGLRPETEIDPGRAANDFSRLVAHAKQLGVTVCLENLRRGITSNPEIVRDWARQADSPITIDIGHATCCQRVLDGEVTAIDFIDMFADRLLEVHMYEKETDRHHPPEDMTILGPIVDRLLKTDCEWWTIELDYPEEAFSTRRLLAAYLGKTISDRGRLLPGPEGGR